MKVTTKTERKLLKALKEILHSCVTKKGSIKKPSITAVRKTVRIYHEHS